MSLYFLHSMVLLLLSVLRSNNSFSVYGMVVVQLGKREVVSKTKKVVSQFMVVIVVTQFET